MTYQLTIERKPTDLHAMVTGRNSRENVTQYLAEILREFAARNCFRVLIEERLEGPRLGTLDVFQIASQGRGNVRGMLKAIAYAESDLMQFAETTAFNRGLPVAVYSSVAEAEKSLLDEDRRRGA